jgi:hypothetical protein
MSINDFIHGLTISKGDAGVVAERMDTATKR